jgi:hypothetical protein
MDPTLVAGAEPARRGEELGDEPTVGDDGPLLVLDALAKVREVEAHGVVRRLELKRGAVEINGSMPARTAINYTVWDRFIK